MPGSDSLRLYASYGTAYRTPTFNELFFPFFGNPDLRAGDRRNLTRRDWKGQHERFELEYPGVSTLTLMT